MYEAMATSNIILTTKHAGIPDVFKDGVNGFYVEKKSDKSISDRLIVLGQNLKSFNYIAKNNYNEAEEKYRINGFIDKLYLILQA